MAMTTKIVSSFGTLLNHTPTSKGLKVFCKQNNAGKTFTTLNADGIIIKEVEKEGAKTKIYNYDRFNGAFRRCTHINKNENGLSRKSVSFFGYSENMLLHTSVKNINKQPDGTLEILEKSFAEHLKAPRKL